MAHNAVTGFGSGGQLHSECMYCQDFGHTVDPTECHKCAVELDDVERLAYEKLLDASRRGNLEDVVRFALSVPRRAAYNRERGAIQIKAACDPSSIVASLRLETPEQRRTAMALPGVDPRSATVVVGLQ